MGKWLLLIPELLVVVLLAGIGYAVKYRKAYGLISGYNTMSDEQKKNVDIEGLGRFIGNFLFVLAVLVGAMLACFTLGFLPGGLAALGLLLAAVVFAVARAQKYDGNAKKPGGGYTPRTIATVAAVIVLLGGVVAFVAVMVGSSSKPIGYEISGGDLKIQCSFGTSVALKNISGLELLQTRPDISTRTWGSAVGEKLRGNFLLSDGTAAKVYVDSAKPPFIHFSVGGTQYYLNCATPANTEQLYGKLFEALK